MLRNGVRFSSYLGRMEDYVAMSCLYTDSGTVCLFRGTRLSDVSYEAIESAQVALHA